MHAIRPVQATPVARRIPLLQVETREKKSYEKKSEEEKSLLVRLRAEKLHYLESKDVKKVWERILDRPFQVCERLDRNQSGKQSVFY